MSYVTCGYRTPRKEGQCMEEGPTSTFFVRLYSHPFSQILPCSDQRHVYSMPTSTIAEQSTTGIERMMHITARGTRNLPVIRRKSTYRVNIWAEPFTFFQNDWTTLTVSGPRKKGEDTPAVPAARDTNQSPASFQKISSPGRWS